MLGNISRHSVQYSNWGNTKTASLEKCSINNFQRTTGSQEQRFNILKNIVLNGKRASRLDDFTNKLYKHFLSCEKMYVAQHLRKQYREPAKNKTSLVQENWDKKYPLKSLTSPKVGKYQKASPAGIDIPNSHSNRTTTESTLIADIRKSVVPSKITIERNFCPIPNIGNTCWVSSSLQILHPSFLCAAIFENSGRDIDDANVTVTSALLACLKHMSTKSPQLLPPEYIKAFFFHGIHIPGVPNLKFNIQQDAYDFFENVVKPSLPHVWNVKSVTTTMCVACNRVVRKTRL
jgi:hypothetical protein